MIKQSIELRRMKKKMARQCITSDRIEENEKNEEKKSVNRMAPYNLLYNV